MNIKLTKQQEVNNYGQFIHEFLYTADQKALISRIEILEGRPAIPKKATATVESNGDITLTLTAVKDAQAYVPHYGPANSFDPKKAIFMGYTETLSWTLKAADIPVPHNNGDVIYIWIQAFKDKGTGSTDIEKAASLNDGTHWGSEWSEPVVVTIKNPVPAADVTVKYVDSSGKEIHEKQTISGYVGDSYDATTDTYKLSIADYTIDSTKLPSNATGTLSSKAQTVTYVYTAN